ncbi:MAG: MFS transporter [Candidatus Promineifilaceae bacterium]
MAEPDYTRPRSAIFQQRVNPQEYEARPQRWNWYALIRPLDRSLEEQAERPLPSGYIRNLRHFWLDGLFAAVSDNLYLSFIPLYALAFGASNSQVGLVTAAANLLGALSFFPGARLVEQVRWRKPLVLLSGGWLGRLALLGLALVPLLAGRPEIAIALIVLLNGLRSFLGNLANPAWTSLVADLVPEHMRGRYLSGRNTAMGLAGLAVVPVAGYLINRANTAADSEVVGYQLAFGLAFAAGLVSAFFYSRISEPFPRPAALVEHRRGDLRRALRTNLAFAGLVGGAFIWNLALQMAAPYFNVYLVRALGATTTAVGLLAAVSSLTALPGQLLFSRLLDRKGATWVLLVTGFLIPLLPLGWLFVTQPWQVGIINTFGGLWWAGYNLANLSLLLLLTPERGRVRAVALFQTAVFSAAVAGPLLGGYLADAAGFKLIFLLSGIGRFAGSLIFAAAIWRAGRAPVPSTPSP